MSELCLSSTSKTPRYSSRLLLSDLMFFFSFLQSHPLYIPYFIFFLPYLLKLLSFLSPLFITTSLLLLGFLTLSPSLVRENSSLDLSESKAGFLLSTYHAVLERLRSSRAENEDEDEDFHHFEELEAYKMVFDTSSFYSRERSDEVSRLSSEESCFQAVEAPLLKPSSDPEYTGLTTLGSFFAGLEEKTVEIDWQENTKIIKEERRLEGLLKELDEFENVICKVEEKKVELPRIKSDKVAVKQELSLERRGSKAMSEKTSEGTDNGREYTSKVEINNSQSFQENVYSLESGGVCSSKLMEEGPRTRSLDSNLGSYGSMRREKEWKRTLACKLFEERHNVSGDEGMDSLWETYEMDSSNKTKSESKGKKKKKKKGVPEYFEDDEDVEEEDDDLDGKLCCLQALKFSAGKMNLGMGKPNLVKFSKAIKGIGWLHSVTRHVKKGYN